MTDPPIAGTVDSMGDPLGIHVRFTGGVKRPDWRKVNLLLQELDGELCIPIAVGEGEWAAINQASKDLSDRRAAAWTDADVPIDPSIDPAEPIEAVAFIDSFVDGSFTARMLTWKDGERVHTAVRPTDAVATALRSEAPMVIHSEVVARTAMLRRAPESDADKHVLLVSRGPVATFPQLRSEGLRLFLRMATVCAFGAAALPLVLSVVAEAIASGRPHDSVSQASASAAAVRFLVLGLISALLAIAAISSRDQFAEAELRIHSTGPTWAWLGRPVLTARWSDFADAGPFRRTFVTPDGLRFRSPLKTPRTRIPVNGIALSDFDPDWRSGEIGRLVRLYAPHLLGVAVEDPDGGSLPD